LLSFGYVEARGDDELGAGGLSREALVLGEHVDVDAGRFEAVVVAELAAQRIHLIAIALQTYDANSSSIEAESSLPARFGVGHAEAHTAQEDIDHPRGDFWERRVHRGRALRMHEHPGTWSKGDQLRGSELMVCPEHRALISVQVPAHLPRAD